MPEQALYEKFAGWGAATIMGLANLLFMTWHRLYKRRMQEMDERLDMIDRDLKHLGDTKASIKDVRLRLDENAEEHARLFKKSDDIHKEINETRREINGNTDRLIALIRNGGTKI